MIRVFFKKSSASVLVILFLFSAASACSPVTSTTPGSTDQPEITIASATASDTAEQEIIIEREIDYGPGPFDFPDPKVGLSDLSSYTASVTISFDGTRAGQPEKWSKSYVMVTIQEPAARQVTINKSGNSENAEPVFIAEIDGAQYEKQGQAACDVTAIQPDTSLADRFEPARFVEAVIGAEEAGSETVSEVATNHYSFDQRALGEEGISESTGEFWVASEGGYLVKYLLTRKAKADYFGEGVEGTLTLDYELADVNKSDLAVALPEDCPPGFVDAPLLPDVNNTSNIPGVLAYETSTSIAEAAAFYQQNIPQLGWQTQDPPSITEKIALLTYKQRDELMVIVIKPGTAKTQVRITLNKLQDQPVP